MLKFYRFLQKKIQHAENELANKIRERQTRPHAHYFFYFSFAWLNLRLFLWGLLGDAVKFIIILYKDPGASFDLFFRQNKNTVCPYSYARYKKVREKIRWFSFAGASTLIVLTVITSLILNLVIGPSLPTWAATYTFNQTAWNSQTASNGADPGNRGGWTDYESKSANLATGTVLSILAVASSSSQTVDADFNTGSTNLTSIGGDSVKLSPMPGGFGSGADGAITVSTTTNINTAIIAGGRSCADGINYNVLSLSSNAATLATTTAVGCLTTNDKVLLINLQGDGTNITNVGNYEILDVQSVSTNVVTFTGNKAKYYGSGAGNDTNVGTTTTKQRVILQRIPQYTNVTIQSGGSLTANAWDGSKGGVLAFYASGTVEVQSGGSINIGIKGYRNLGSWGVGGESIASSTGGLGSGAASAFTDDSYCPITYFASGGGYGTAGENKGGGGGSAFGSPDLSKIFMGSGGGDGGSAGGGILFMKADTVVIAGDVFSNGGDGLINQGAGGSAGGSIFLNGNTISVGTNKLIATGGAGSFGSDECISGYGGFGGVGRIHLKSNSISGTTNPAAATSSLTITYYSSGTFTSGAIDVGQNVSSWGNLNWTHSGGQTITLKARSDADGDFSDATAWSSCSNITSGNALATGGCATNGHRYVQYQAALSGDTTATPSLDDVTIGYNFYPDDQELIASPYDSSAETNIMGSLAWDEDASLPAGSGVIVSLRTASTSSDLNSASWYDFTSTSTNCTKLSGTVTCSSAALPAAFKTNNDDRWFQYKVKLISSGENTPTVSEVRIQYVVNAPPEVQTVTATQGSDGLVSIGYETRDPDTTTGSPANQGKVTPSFYYSINGGGNWSEITTGLTAGATDPKTVVEDTWNAYALTWDPKIMNINSYSTSTQIRVSINDLEGANNIGSATSTSFSMDAKKPALGTPAITIQATGTPAALSIVASDDSEFCMKISLNQLDLNEMSGCVTYVATSSISLATDPAMVYIRFKDAYQNLSDIASVETPETPTSLMVQDISNMLVSPPEYRIFLAWKTSTMADFSNYYIFESLDNSNFILRGSISDIAQNYFSYLPAQFDTLYYYKVATADTIGNVSPYSTVVQGKANGVQDAGEGGGGTPSTPPAISNVATSSVYTSQVTITWETDKLSDSRVEFIMIAGGDFSSAPSQGVTSMVDTAANIGLHQVTLNNLLPGTDYYFQVKSTDAFDNTGVSKDSTDGYLLTTLSGPVISQVNANPISNESEEISWITDVPTDSIVYYSTDSSLASSTQLSENDPTSGHSLTLTNLTPGTRYYYYVKSDVAIDNNQGAYYSFTTNIDNTAPAISAVAASLVTDQSALISWITDEPADSRLEITTTSGNYSSPPTTLNSLDLNHAMALSSLASSTTFYYRVSSSDASGNSATSSEYNFLTSETLVTETVAEAREDAAKEQGIQEQIAATPASSGGGVLVVDNSDKTVPTLTGIQTTDLKSESVTISWQTSEAANSFVKYGLDNIFTDGYGEPELTTKHIAKLKNLSPEQLYKYKVFSADSSGNLAASQELSFTTPSILDELSKDEKSVSEIEALAKSDKEKESLLVSAAQKAMDIVSQVAGEVSLNVLENTLYNQYDSLAKLANAIPAPLFGGEPSVITTANGATIAWRTDKDASSLVAYAPAPVYEINQGKDERYLQVVGNSEAKTRAHLVAISGLTPETTYHYQLRSKAALGPQAKSRDFTFKTKSETLEITNYAVENITAQKAAFKWLTNLETDSQVKYIPYRNNSLAVDEFKIKTEKAFTTLHDLTIDDFEGGVVYEIELSGKDLKGNLVTKTLPTFSTSQDDLPPEISSVQTDSAISPGKDVKIQTIITWQTNEPAIGRVMYEKGISNNEALAESTAMESNYTKKHVVVITKFDPGAVYTFKIEAKDSAGNVNLSKTFTILTPRQKETVFQLILKNFESTFGWVNKLGF